MIYISKNGKVDRSRTFEDHAARRDWHQASGHTWSTEGWCWVDADGNKYRTFVERDEKWYVVKYFSEDKRNSVMQDRYEKGELQHAKGDARAGSADGRAVVYRASVQLGRVWYDTVCEYRNGVYKSLSRSGKCRS